MKKWKSLRVFWDGAFYMTPPHNHRDLVASSHGGGFSGPVVPQEGRDLALVEIDVEAVDSRTRVPVEHLHQVLDLHPQHQAQRVALVEQLTCMRKGC